MLDRVQARASASAAVTSDAELRMIEAAERIVAEEGLGAMSLRAVQAAAGQRNKSAAQYHFGSRDGLIEAVIAHRMAPINVRRRVLLDGLGAHPSTHDLVDAFIRPTAEAVLDADDSRWARFVLAGFSDPTLNDAVRRNIEGEAFRASRERLLAALEHLPPAVRRIRLEQALGLAILTLAGVETQGRRGLDRDVAVADLVDVCTAIVEAPGQWTGGTERR